MTKPILYIGNKNYSSWSMRAWLTLTWGGIPFEERIVPLVGEGVGKARIPAVLAVSATGRVPVLHFQGEGVAMRIWDSLAICEWAAEQNPRLWPADPLTRAVARSASAEIHSGVAPLRAELHVNLRRRTVKTINDDTRAAVSRVFALWGELRGRYGAKGPFLFGERSIADAMFAPVCTRFRTYGIPVDGAAKAYCDTIFADPDFVAWDKAAEIEPWTMPHADAL